MKASLKVLSDPICPWCWIGKAKLDAALAQREEAEVAVSWLPFQLNPDMPPEGMDRTTYLEAKFGGPQNARVVYGRIEQAAQAAGLDVHFDRIRRTPNTLDAHRVIRWAAEDGAQETLVAAMFAAYFREGADLGDREVLAGLASDAGMDGERVTARLATDEDRERLLAEEAAAREAGVSGVPTFVVNDRLGLVGAQETDQWLKVLDRLAMEPIGEG